ncbi:GNAT family N-acetyltransferase [Oryzomicrobium sp.]|uniref:GNAT family N-acetyltransferase n=1 Tax=Oryzomicrobium sp. TaxID=1911578 RepID=UPI002FE0A47D
MTSPLPHSGCEVVIRPMTADDLPAVLAIQARCYHADLLESAATFAAKLRYSGDTCWVACDGANRQLAYLFAQPAAYLHPPRLDSAPDGDPAAARKANTGADLVLHLHDLAVDRTARGLALGERLVAQAFAAAREAGLARLTLVAVQQSGAFWERFGFTAPDHPLPPALTEELASYGADACYRVAPALQAIDGLF